MSKKPIITICSSANFYRKVIAIQAKLEARGYKALVPLTANKMKKSGDYDASHYRTWLKDAGDYHKKAVLMREHFSEVENGDAILVVNETKHGIANYIGGNVLIEMALAFYLGKPVYIWNDIPAGSNFLEEILGIGSVPLHSSFDQFVSELKKIQKARSLS